MNIKELVKKAVGINIGSFRESVNKANTNILNKKVYVKPEIDLSPVDVVFNERLNALEEGGVSGEVSWDNIKDKPFGDTKCDLIEDSYTFSIYDEEIDDEIKVAQEYYYCKNFDLKSLEGFSHCISIKSGDMSQSGCDDNTYEKESGIIPGQEIEMISSALGTPYCINVTNEYITIINEEAQEIIDNPQLIIDNLDLLLMLLFMWYGNFKYGQGVYILKRVYLKNSVMNMDIEINPDSFIKDESIFITKKIEEKYIDDSLRKRSIFKIDGRIDELEEFKKEIERFELQETFVENIDYNIFRYSGGVDVGIYRDYAKYNNITEQLVYCDAKESIPNVYLYSFSDKTTKTILLDVEKISRVYCVTIDSEGYIWAAGLCKDVARINPNTNEIEYIHFSENFVDLVHCDSSKEKVLVSFGFTGVGLCTFCRNEEMDEGWEYNYILIWKVHDVSIIGTDIYASIQSYRWSGWPETGLQNYRCGVSVSKDNGKTLSKFYEDVYGSYSRYGKVSYIENLGYHIEDWRSSNSLISTDGENFYKFDYDAESILPIDEDVYLDNKGNMIKIKFNEEDSKYQAVGIYSSIDYYSSDYIQILSILYGTNEISVIALDRNSIGYYKKSLDDIEYIDFSTNYKSGYYLSHNSWAYNCFDIYSITTSGLFRSLEIKKLPVFRAYNRNLVDDEYYMDKYCMEFIYNENNNLIAYIQTEGDEEYECYDGFILGPIKIGEFINNEDNI